MDDGYVPVRGSGNVFSNLEIQFWGESGWARADYLGGVRRTHSRPSEKRSRGTVKSVKLTYHRLVLLAVGYLGSVFIGCCVTRRRTPLFLSAIVSRRTFPPVMEWTPTS